MGEIFIGIFLTVSAFLLSHYGWKDYSIIVAFFGGYVFCIGIISLEEKPSAIDVYRGRTTLEITYRDNVPVDSVVVFKTIKNKK